MSHLTALLAAIWVGLRPKRRSESDFAPHDEVECPDCGQIYCEQCRWGPKHTQRCPRKAKNGD